MVTKKSKSMQSESSLLPIVGNSTKISLAGIKHVPAKIDTGATVSSIWASDIHLTPDNHLVFRLFAPSSVFYTGEPIITKEYKVRKVRNSTGHETIRYMVTISTLIKKKRIRISYTLADRSRNDFPVLIGRRALKGKFLVDVSKLGVPYPSHAVNDQLNAELSADPKKFHLKYMNK